MKKAIHYLGFIFTAIVFTFATVSCFGISACFLSNTKLAALPVPGNFEFDAVERTIVWNEVPDATGYAVTFEDRESETQEPNFMLPYTLQAGKHKVEVMALGDYENYSDSDWITFSFTVEEPPEHAFDDAGWEYTLSEDGQGYEISRGTADLTGSVVIPSYFKGLPVVKIVDDAFMYYNGTLPDPSKGTSCNLITTEITIPNTVKSIGKFAFGAMLILERVTMGDSVTEIGNSAFWSCFRLKHVTFSKNLKKIDDGCFYDCALSEISLPQGLEEIGGKAFCNGALLSGLGDANPSFTKIDIPSSVKRIGNGAFAYCTNLEEINLPDEQDFKPEYLGQNIFIGTAWYSSQPDGFVTLGNILLDYKGKIAEGEKVIIPSEIKYIGSDCFFRQDNLTEIVIPDGVQIIGENVFQWCKFLKKVKLPAGMTEIPSSTFRACQALEEFVIPDGITTIGEGAFAGCSSLQKVIFPEGLKSIGQRAFFGCPLTEIVLPDSMESIDNEAFSECSALTKVVLPDGLKSLGNSAFRNCSSLEEIVIPSSLENLGRYPFRECDNLSKIYYKGTEESWKVLKEPNDAFVNGKGELILIPTQDSFSDATIYCFSETQPQTTGNYWRYVNGVPTVWE